MYYKILSLITIFLVQYIIFFLNLAIDLFYNSANGEEYWKNNAEWASCKIEEGFNVAVRFATKVERKG